MGVASLNAGKNFSKAVYLPAFGFMISFYYRGGTWLLVALCVYVVAASWVEPVIKRIVEILSKAHGTPNLDDVFTEVEARRGLSLNTIFVITAVGYLGSFVVYSSVIRESRLIALLTVIQLIYIIRLSLTALQLVIDRRGDIVESLT
jgi:hypothetical protein